MPYRTSLRLLRFLGIVYVLAAFLCVAGVMVAYLRGVQGTPHWFYYMVWPYATPLLVGAMICSLVGTIFLLYPAQMSSIKESGYELWRG